VSSVSVAVKLSEDELKGLEHLVKSGRYRNRSEAVRAAIELLLYRLAEATRR